MRKSLVFLLVFVVRYDSAVLAAPEIVWQSELEDRAGLEYWTGDRAASSSQAVVRENPAPQSGVGCLRFEFELAARDSGYSYWVLQNFRRTLLEPGRRYTLHGSFRTENCAVAPKVRGQFQSGQDPIWHTGAVDTKGEWQPFEFADIRGWMMGQKQEGWDDSTIHLINLFFNLEATPGQKAALCLDHVVLEAEGEALPQLVREPGSDFRLPVAFPILEVRVSQPVPNLHGWAVDEAGGEQPILDTHLPFSSEVETVPAEIRNPKSEGTSRRYLVKLKQGAPTVRFALVGGGVEGTAPSSVSGEGRGGGAGPRIETVRLVGTDGRVLEPARTEGDAQLTPGTGSGDEAQPGPAYTVHFDANVAVAMREDRRAWFRPRVGVYYAPYAINDPSHVPPGSVWQPSAKQIAPYDFTVFQANSYPDDNLARLAREVRELNPEHRVILRGTCRTFVLEYTHEPLYRRGLIEYFKDLIRQVGPEHIYALTLGEEENGNTCSGLWWRDTPPLWIARWLPVFTEETGLEVQWVNAVCGDRNFLHWMKPQLRWAYNDLYDHLKEAFPNLKVLQYIALKDDGSDIAWHEPGELKADGWVYWNWGPPASVAIPGRFPEPMRKALEVEDGTPVLLWAPVTLHHMQRIRESGIPNAEIYHCGFAHQQGLPDVIQQLEWLREAGYENSFNFYPTHAFLDPQPGGDLSQFTPYEGGNWVWVTQQRQRVLEYAAQMKKEP